MFLNLFHFVIGFYPGILYQVYVVNKFNALTKYSKNYAQLKRIQISCQKIWQITQVSLYLISVFNFLYMLIMLEYINHLSNI